MPVADADRGAEILRIFVGASYKPGPFFDLFTHWQRHGYLPGTPTSPF